MNPLKDLDDYYITVKLYDHTCRSCSLASRIPLLSRFRKVFWTGSKIGGNGNNGRDNLNSYKVARKRRRSLKKYRRRTWEKQYKFQQTFLIRLFLWGGSTVPNAETTCGISMHRRQGNTNTIARSAISRFRRSGNESRTRISTKGGTGSADSGAGRGRQTVIGNNP